MSITFESDTADVYSRLISSHSLPLLPPPPLFLLPAAVPLWWNVNRMYFDTNKNYVSGDVSMGKEYSDVAKSQGSLTTSSRVASIVTNAVSQSQLPVDGNAIYAVLTDRNTPQSGAPGAEAAAFCVNYCGWHGTVQYRGTQLKYVFTGNAQFMVSVNPSCKCQPVRGGGCYGACKWAYNDFL